MNIYRGIDPLIRDKSIVNKVPTSDRSFPNSPIKKEAQQSRHSVPEIVPNIPMLSKVPKRKVTKLLSDREQVMVLNIWFIPGQFGKDWEQFWRKSIFLELFNIYNSTFKVFTIKCYTFLPTPLSFIKYILKYISCQTFENSFCSP